MKSINVFEVGEMVWVGDYKHTERKEILIGPLPVDKITAARDCNSDNIVGALFLYLVGGARYWNGGVVATREEAQQRITTERRRCEKIDEDKAAVEALKAKVAT